MTKNDFEKKSDFFRKKWGENEKIVFLKNFLEKNRNFEIFIFQIDFPKIFFSIFFDLGKIFFRDRKKSKKISFLKKVFSMIKKYFLSRFFFYDLEYTSTAQKTYLGL